MFRNINLLALIMVMTACHSSWENKNNVSDASSTEIGYGINRLPLTGYDFKVPVPPGYNWEISQSWKSHCKLCDQKYGGSYLSFCDSSHAVIDYANDGWDFNLPGNSDKGKSVLASADGSVKDVGYTKGWGNFALIDHGNNICTRYAHMLDSSVTVFKDNLVCQGLKIGEIGMTGDVSGEHLHFQFEDCDTHLPLAMAFTDGNGVPMCIMDKDIYTDGVYTAIKLTNVEKSYCKEEDLYTKDPPDAGSAPKVCNMECPMNLKCSNTGQSPFGDINSYDNSTSWAVNYLWHECAVTGKSDGDFHAYDSLTRAEALKIALVLFGLDKKCGSTAIKFWDVNQSDWFYPYVLCAVSDGILSQDKDKFNPNQEVTFAEAAKMAVESAVKANKAEIQTGTYANFTQLENTDWSYQYLQTLAYYNGIDKELLQKNSSDLVTRGQYSRMVAALSPCYCEKNQCQGGCECNQASYVCGPVTVAKGDDPGSGKYGSSGGEVDAFSVSIDAGSSKPDVCNPYCYQKECGSDLCGGNCGTCPSGKFCEAQYGKCTDICVLPACADIGCECGKCPLSSPGCDGTSLVCGECPDDKVCNDGKCEAKQVTATVQQVPCDPSKGYEIYFSTTNTAKWEIGYSPNPSYSSGLFSEPTFWKVECNELPAFLRISNLTSKATIWVKDTTLAPFVVWPDSKDTSIPLKEPTKENLVKFVLQYFTAPAGNQVLIKIPKN